MHARGEACVYVDTFVHVSCGRMGVREFVNAREHERARVHADGEAFADKGGISCPLPTACGALVVKYAPLRRCVARCGAACKEERHKETRRSGGGDLECFCFAFAWVSLQEWTHAPVF